MTDLIEPVRSYILSHHAPHLDARRLDTRALLGEGILQSIDVVDLVLFIEKTYQISIPAAEVIPENFDSIAAIQRLVAAQQGLAPRS